MPIKDIEYLKRKIEEMAEQAYPTKGHITSAPHQKTRYEKDAYYWVKIKFDGWYTAYYAGEEYGFSVCGLPGYKPPEYFERISTQPIAPPLD